MHEIEYRYAETEELSPDHAIRASVLIPGQMDLALFRENCSHRDQRIVDVFAHGLFPKEDPETQVILTSWLADHEQYFFKLHELGIQIPVTCVGVDIGRSLTGDPSVIAAGSEIGIAAFHEKHIRSTIGVAKWVCGYISKTFNVKLREGKVPVVVDATGIGSGVADQLRSEGVWVIEFFGNATADINPRQWNNLRTQSYATLGGRLDPSGPFSEVPADYDPAIHGPLVHTNPWAIPPSDRFRREIVAPEKKFSGDMIRFGIEPKDLIKIKLNGQSPDYADAATMLWHGITVFRNLQSYFASYSGPLTVWPQPTAEQSEWLERDDAKRSAKLQRENAESIYAGFGIDVAKAGSYNDDSHGGDSSVGDGGSESGSAAVDGGGSGVSPTLEWLRQRYGDGGESERGGKFDRFFGE